LIARGTDVERWNCGGVCGCGVSAAALGCCDACGAADWCRCQPDGKQQLGSRTHPHRTKSEGEFVVLVDRSRASGVRASSLGNLRRGTRRTTAGRCRPHIKLANNITADSMPHGACTFSVSHGRLGRCCPWAGPFAGVKPSRAAAAHASGRRPPDMTVRVSRTMMVHWCSTAGHGAETRRTAAVSRRHATGCDPALLATRAPCLPAHSSALSWL
jgi:hypothetical protein